MSVVIARRADTGGGEKLFLMALLTLSLSAFLVGAAFASSKQFYFDEGWDIRLRSNCKMPRNGNAEVDWVDSGGIRQLSFLLEPNDVGGCSSDNKQRSGAKFWERAELIQADRLEFGSSYEISFQASLQSGFTGRRETFFQLHGWHRDCQGPPLAMVMMDRSRLRVRVGRIDMKNPRLDRHGNPKLHMKFVSGALVPISRISGRPVDFRILLDLDQSRTTLTVWADEIPVVQNVPIHVAPCARPRIKVGIYRPGGGANSKPSHIQFSGFSLKERELS